MDKAVQDLGRKIAIRNRRQKARNAIDNEAAQIILNGKRNNLVLSDIAQQLNEAGKKTSTGNPFGNVQVFRALKMLEADDANDDANDYVEDSVNDDVTIDVNEQVDIEAEILRSKLVAQLKAENAELAAERDKVNESLAELQRQLEASQSAFKRLREENEDLLAQLDKTPVQASDDKAMAVINEFRSKMKDTRNWTEFKKFIEELEHKKIL